jgi:anti-sigma factor RsiW
VKGTYDRDFMTRYLLGKLSDAERSDEEEFEKEYFENDELFDELDKTENELIDQYARGELPADLRAEFEKGFCTSEGRKRKVEFARAIIGHPAAAERLETVESGSMPRRRVVNPPGPLRIQEIGLPQTASAESETLQPQESSATKPAKPGPRRLGWDLGLWFPKLAIAACGVALVLAGWLAIKNRLLDTRLRQAQAELRQRNRQIEGLEASQQLSRAVPVPQPHEQQGKSPKSAEAVGQPPRGTRRTVSFVLAAGVFLRGQAEPLKRFVIPKDAVIVRLIIQFQGAPYPIYRVSMETPDGNLIDHWDSLKSRVSGTGEREVALELRASSLDTGDYILKLTGAGNTGDEAIATYVFSVVKP